LDNSIVSNRSKNSKQKLVIIATDSSNEAILKSLYSKNLN